MHDDQEVNHRCGNRGGPWPAMHGRPISSLRLAKVTKYSKTSHRENELHKWKKTRSSNNGIQVGTPTKMPFLRLSPRWKNENACACMDAYTCMDA